MKTFASVAVVLIIVQGSLGLDRKYNPRSDSLPARLPDHPPRLPVDPLPFPDEARPPQVVEGKCPIISYPCGVRECKNDFECGRDRLCCHQGCASRCEFRTKPGSCPRNSLRSGSSRCGRPCRSDMDCPGAWKCCRRGLCGNMCTPPRRY